MPTHFIHALLSNVLVAAAPALAASLAGALTRRPALTHCLWLLMLVKLLTPPLLAVPLGHNLAAAISARPITTDAGAGTGTSAQDPASFFSLANDSSLRAPPGRTARAPVSPGPDRSRWLGFIAAVLWTAGSVICVGITFFRVRRFSQLLAMAEPASSPIRLEATDAARLLNLRSTPVVRMLPGPIGPMLWPGLGSPSILLPATLWPTLPFSQRQALLLHELAHCKRRDHWVRLLELLATVAYWWNPLVWWARSRLRQAEEQCCDAWVTSARPNSARDYSKALVETVNFAFSAKVRAEVHFSTPPLATGASDFHHLKRRLRMIHEKTSHPRLGASGVAVALVAAMLLPLTLTLRAQTGPPGAENPPDAAKAAHRREAVGKGLAWLAQNLPLPKSSPAPDPRSNQTAVLSFSGLAFLASGSDLQQGDYRAPLTACLEAVLDDCHDDGLIVHPGLMAVMYHHGYATLFLAETYALTHDQRIRPKLERAVALLERSQGAAGGWRYQPQPLDADVSVTACALNALLSAKAAGINVKPLTLERAVAFISSCKRPDGGYSYLPGPDGASAAPRSAAAAAVLLRAAGAPADTQSIIKLLDPFFSRKNEVPSEHFSYATFYASELLAASDTGASKSALGKVSDALIARQQVDGSWDTKTIGPAYDTACALIALQAADTRLNIFSHPPRQK